MEPQQNVAIMQRAYEAFNTGDMSTLTELMDETVWHLPGRSSMAGDYQGRGATLAYFGQLAQKTVHLCLYPRYLLQPDFVNLVGREIRGGESPQEKSVRVRPALKPPQPGFIGRTRKLGLKCSRRLLPRRIDLRADDFFCLPAKLLAFCGQNRSRSLRQ